ncbi:hypothetical protein BDB01DRAFT_800413 [Pilobolus umbonatus]|nr:hypothetical protein BDB01DRAFT_800413 [Pilobolus umbonatus]
MSPESTESVIQGLRAVDLAIEGYTAGVLMMSVGDADPLYEQRQKNIDDILLGLKERVETSVETIAVEYTYMSITDSRCYDLRTEHQYTNASILKAGLDHFMKRASLRVIMDKVKKGSKYPFILKIRLINEQTGLQGNLFIIDLLHPRFTATFPGSGHINDLDLSFLQLQDVVNILNVEGYSGHINTDTFVLTDTLKLFLSGQAHLTLILYLQSYPNEFLDQTLSALDFIQSFIFFKCKMLPSKQNAQQKALKESNNKLKSLVEKLRAIIELKASQLKYQEICNSEIITKSKSTIRAYKIELTKLDAAADIKRFVTEDQQEQYDRRYNELYQSYEMERERLEMIIRDDRNKMEIMERELNLAQKEIGDLRATMADDRSQYNEYKERVVTQCKEKIQEIKNSYSEKIKQKTDRLTDQLNMQKSSITNEYMVTINNLKDQLNTANNTINDLKLNHMRELDKVSEETRGLQSQVNQLKNSLKAEKLKVKSMTEETEKQKDKQVITNVIDHESEDEYQPHSSHSARPISLTKSKINNYFSTEKTKEKEVVAPIQQEAGGDIKPQVKKRGRPKKKSALQPKRKRPDFSSDGDSF